MGKPVDVLFVGPEEERGFFECSCEDFGYSLHWIRNVDEIVDLEVDPNLVILSEVPGVTGTAEELIQMSRQSFGEAFFMIFVEKELSKAQFDKLVKYGADTVMLKSEVPSAKVGFSINQILQANHVAFKTNDLVADRKIPFDVYHLLPTRKKFLMIVHAGNQLSTDRLKQIGESKELYFHRKDAMAYKKFVEENSDKSSKGLLKRCRANFMALRVEFTRLAFDLSDQSNRVSFGEGQALLKKCQGLCQDLLSNLAEFPEAWKIINNSAIGEFGSLERAPTIAAYCGVFAIMMDLKKVEEIMLVALLIDVGSLGLPNEIARKLRDGLLFTENEAKELHAVPEKSIALALSRKLAMEEKFRQILLSVYENADGSGFPRGINEQKIPLEAQVIRMAKEFDSKTVLKLGKTKVPPAQAVKEILEGENARKVFSEEFLNAAKDNIAASDSFSK